jgi:hypothetical protein
MHVAGRFGSPAAEDLGKAFLAFKGVEGTVIIGLENYSLSRAIAAAAPAFKLVGTDLVLPSHHGIDPHVWRHSPIRHRRNHDLA